jgi:2-polyprenyl-6-methoxyphenol hydroxylase-like FAD-dependent oxidoreductase
MAEFSPARRRDALSIRKQQELRMARHVEIAGAGLAGLCAAARFSQLGWSVTLHERAKDLRMFGAGIWLWESGLRTLAIIGAYDEALARARTIKTWQIVDGRGSVLMSRPMLPNDRMLLPPRADLYQALINRCVANGVEIITSSVVTEVRPEGSLVQEGGKERKADLVIVANGAYSLLREQILGTGWIDFGVEAGIRMMIDSRSGDSTDIITEYWKDAYRLLYNPCTEGENYIFLSAPVGDSRAATLPVDRAFWTEKFPAAAGLIERFSEASRWDRLVNVRCRRWSQGRVVVVGDAAHAMPPNLGQAANTAFNNVMALAIAMDRASDLPSALTAWEEQQRPLTNHVQWWSYIYGFVVAKWPQNFESLRSDAIRFLAKTKWFEEGINRGARHLPEDDRPIPAG